MTKININDSLKKLAEISGWFERQKEVDVELGLEKVREGARLIKSARERLKEIENEFIQIKKEMDLDDDQSNNE